MPISILKKSGICLVANFKMWVNEAALKFFFPIPLFAGRPRQPPLLHDLHGLPDAHRVHRGHRHLRLRGGGVGHPDRGPQRGVPRPGLQVGHRPQGLQGPQADHGIRECEAETSNLFFCFKSPKKGQVGIKIT